MPRMRAETGTADRFLLRHRFRKLRINSVIDRPHLRYMVADHRHVCPRQPDMVVARLEWRLTGIIAARPATPFSVHLDRLFRPLRSKLE